MRAPLGTTACLETFCVILGYTNEHGLINLSHIHHLTTNRSHFVSLVDLAGWGRRSRGHTALQNPHIQQQRSSWCTQVTLSSANRCRVFGTAMCCVFWKINLCLFFLWQPWWSSLGWKHSWSLPGHLRRVWRWLWGWGTNCSHWQMHSHVQLPWYVKGCFGLLPYFLFLKSTVSEWRSVFSQLSHWKSVACL